MRERRSLGTSATACRWCSENEGAECRGARQVVLDPVPGRRLGRSPPLLVGVDNGNVAALVGVGQVTRHACQPLIKKPDPPGIAAGGRGPHDRLDESRSGGGEPPFEDGEVETLVLEGKRQMSFEVSGGGMAGRENAPSVFRADAMALACCREQAGQRHPQSKGIDQSGIAGGRRPLGEGALVKHGPRAGKTMLSCHARQKPVTSDNRSRDGPNLKNDHTA